MIEKPATVQRDAARASRNDRIEEVVLLLSWLTQLSDLHAHLSPVERTTANATMNFVVCVHHGDKRLAWRISDFEAMEYFKHLKTSACPRGMSRSEKMAHMATEASRGNVRQLRK